MSPLFCYCPMCSGFRISMDHVLVGLDYDFLLYTRCLKYCWGTRILQLPVLSARPLLVFLCSRFGIFLFSRFGSSSSFSRFGGSLLLLPLRHSPYFSPASAVSSFSRFSLRLRVLVFLAQGCSLSRWKFIETFPHVNKVYFSLSV